MNFRKLLGIVIGLVLIPSVCLGAGSIKVYSSQTSMNFDEIVLEWASNADGDMTATSPAIVVSGFLYSVEFIWVDADANYDVYLRDEDGADLLDGKGVNLPADNTTFSSKYRTPLTADSTYLPLLNRVVVPVVDETGASKTGRIRLIFQTN